MKSVLTAICLVALALTSAGCGGSGGANTSSDEPLNVQERSGQAVVAVDTAAEADRLCEEVQADPPGELDGRDQVVFDVPGTGADVTCVLPLD